MTILDHEFLDILRLGFEMVIVKYMFVHGCAHFIQWSVRSIWRRFLAALVVTERDRLIYDLSKARRLKK